jgi:hypothetical protein
MMPDPILVLPLRQSVAESIGFDVPHPPYSPHLAPSDFWLFGALKQHLEGCRFICNEEVQAAIAKWFWEQPEKFYSDGSEKLVQCWQCRVEREGDYMEMWGIETEYTIWAIFYASFNCDILGGCKGTNMEAILSEHTLYLRLMKWNVLSC